MVPLSRLRFRHLQLAAAIQLAFLANAAPAPPGDESVEYQVKAAFLLNFTKFIDWPPSAFASPNSPVNVCVLGKDPFGRALDEIVQGEAVKSRRLMVVKIDKAPAPQMCQVLFLGAGERDVPQLIAKLGPGVLTVGEGDGFLREGGMIALVVDGHRVRFDINQIAAANAGLNLSARLLGVARLVEK